jgi:hypothetical protein
VTQLTAKVLVDISFLFYLGLLLKGLELSECLYCVLLLVLNKYEKAQKKQIEVLLIFFFRSPSLSADSDDAHGQSSDDFRKRSHRKDRRQSRHSSHQRSTRSSSSSDSSRTRDSNKKKNKKKKKRSRSPSHILSASDIERLKEEKQLVASSCKL